MTPQTRASEAAKSAEQVIHKASKLTQGQIPDSDLALGHPIHPSTVHWPIAVSLVEYSYPLPFPSFCLPSSPLSFTITVSTVTSVAHWLERKSFSVPGSILYQADTG